jgi:hypothetical protein
VGRWPERRHRNGEGRASARPRRPATHKHTAAAAAAALVARAPSQPRTLAPARAAPRIAARRRDARGNEGWRAHGGRTGQLAPIFTTDSRGQKFLACKSGAGGPCAGCRRGLFKQARPPDFRNPLALLTPPPHHHTTRPHAAAAANHPRFHCAHTNNLPANNPRGVSRASALSQAHDELFCARARPDPSASLVPRSTQPRLGSHPYRHTKRKLVSHSVSLFLSK